jgi:hypothetical protein
MEATQLQGFVQALWDSTPREEAVVWFGGYDEDLELNGNRAGLLRLAAEIITATYDNGDPTYLFHRSRGSQVPGIVSIRISDNPPTPPPPMSFSARIRNKLIAGGCLLLVAFAALCAIAGFVSLMKAVF